MQIRQRQWTLDRLYRERSSINLNPAWQRGPAWRPQRQVLLVDSILRGMDIPKIYLRKLPAGGMHAYDAVDGQQRLRAVWEFRAGNLRLDYPEPLAAIDGHTVAGHTYSSLHGDLKKRFTKFSASVAEIMRSTPDEITNLFSRLQMGVSLNPAELRNALGGPMRHVVDALATSHVFFQECRIPDNRYKRQDYAAHAFAVAAYGVSSDLKAPDLRRMFREYGPDRRDEVLELSSQVGDVLNVLGTVNRSANFRITQKWLFVDLCLLVLTRQRAGAVVDPDKLFAAYQSFDQLRRQHTAEPEVLIRGRRKNKTLDRYLYEYLIAFRVQGGTAGNLEVRAKALNAFCPDIDGGS